MIETVVLGCDAPCATVKVRYSSRSMAVEPSAVSEMRSFARDTVVSWGLCEETVEATRLIVTELVTNTLLHSGSPTVVVTLNLRNRNLDISVEDTGIWKRRRVPSRLAADEATHGRGLQLVHALASTSIDTTGHGTIILATLAALRGAT
jgi:anti-sigma regulatory factor (Ser/Thr protein kinase)